LLQKAENINKKKEKTEISPTGRRNRKQRPNEADDFNTETKVRCLKKNKNKKSSD